MPTKILKHVFTARGAALEALNYRGSEVLLAGPAGTGKSRAALEKVHLVCLMSPNVRALILRKTARSLATSALKTWERDVIKQAVRDGTVNYYGGSAREPAQYRYKNGSSVAIGGLDDPMKIMSTEYDLVYIQEATEVTETDWENVTTRLRNGAISFQQLIADCNPGAPTHFLLERDKAGKLKHLHSRHEDNPRYFNEDGTKTEAGIQYIDGILEKLTGVRYLRLRKGLWAAAEGVIWDGYDPAIHHIDPITINPAWDRVWSIDFGYTNPFVWQDWAIDHDGRAYLVREIYMTQRLVEDHAAQIRFLNGKGRINADGSRQKYEGPEVYRWQRCTPSAIICDHDAEDRATLERYLGMGTIAADKAVASGIEAVASRWKIAGDGRPRQFILKNSLVELDQTLKDRRLPTRTAEEIPGYIWAPEPPSADRKDRIPVKRNDHGCDAMRYFDVEIDTHGPTQVRWG